jgi:hypothetical protein
MRRCRLSMAIGVVLFCTASLGAQSTNVLTWHNDNWRTGANTTETTLTTANVTQATFGKLCTAPTDGAINAQPLIVTHVPISIAGTVANHDVVYVATENDTLYAFDANNCALLKKASLVVAIKGCVAGTTCEQPIDCHSVGAGGCFTLAPTVGVLGTPVINTVPVHGGTGGTIYVEAETQVGAGRTPSVWRHRIHALDITTLLEEPGSPGLIKGSFAPLAFNPRLEIQRAGLLLLNGVGPNGDSVVYFGFSLLAATATLKPPGWVFGYDVTNLSQQPAGLPYVFSPTPNGVGPYGPGGGIWQAGAGISAGLASASDPTTYMYVATGDGTFDANTGGSDYGDSFVKLDPTLHVAAYFTRSDEEMYQAADKDYGSGGMMLVPDNTISTNPFIAINAGKDGNTYVIDRGTPGGFNGASNTNTQTVPGNSAYFGTPAFWNRHLYNGVRGSVLKSWLLSSTCNPGPVCSTNTHFSDVKFSNGVTPSVSANGNVVGTGIVWSIDTMNQVNGGPPAVLYAFDAGSLAELYASNQCGGADTAGPGVKFSVPTIANGKVYVGTQTELNVYGKLHASRTCP